MQDPLTERKNCLISFPEKKLISFQQIILCKNDIFRPRAEEGRPPAVHFAGGEKREKLKIGERGDTQTHQRGIPDSGELNKFFQKL